MDIASIVGLVVAIILVIISISLGDAGFAGIIAFLDAPSAMITFGGAFCAVLIMTPGIKEYVSNLK